MAAFDQSVAAPILKTRYPTKKILQLAYKKSPLLGMLPKFPDFGGDQKNFVPKYARTQGGSISFGTAQANAVGSSYAKFALTRVEDFSVASIKGQTIKATQGDANALVSALESEIDSAIMTAAESAQVSLYRNGGGARGQITSGQTTATITLTNAADIVHFEKNMWIQSASTDGTSGSVNTGHAQIVGIDRDLGTLTFSANLNTLIPAVGASDYLFREGDFGGTMSGLSAWIPSSAPTSTAFFGVDRTSDVTRLGGIRYNGSGGPMDEVIIEASARAIREHATPDVLFINNLDYSPLIKLLGTKREYTEAGSTEPSIGYRAVEIETEGGPVKIIPDPYCPKGTGFLLQMDTWELASLDEVPHILDLDGNKFLREAGADAYAVRIGYYANLGCYAPGWNVRITW